MTELKENSKRRLSRRAFLKSVGVGIGAATATGLLKHVPALAKPPAQETITLRAMTIGNPQRAETFEAVLGPFREANPNIKLELVPVAAPEWDAYLAKVATIIASGQQLDNVEVGTEGQQTFAKGGIIQPLDKFAMDDKADIQDYFSDVNPVFIEAVMLDGSLYNLPSLWAAAGIYYNKKLFDQAGVAHPTDDWTIEDFKTAASKIGALGENVYGHAWPNRHWGGFVAWSFANDANILVQKQGEGGDWLWDTFYSDLTPEQRAQRGGGYYWPESMANDPKNVEALKMLQDMAHVEKVSYAGDFADILSAFENGQIGMIPSHRAWVSRFKAAGLTPDDYDVVYMPMWKTRKHQFGGSALAITTLSKQPQAAWALLKYMTSRDVQFKYVSGGVHTATRRSVMMDPKQHEGLGPNNWKAFYNMVDETPAAPIPAPAQNKDFTVSFTKWIGLAMANEITPQEALDNMHDELSKIVVS